MYTMWAHSVVSTFQAPLGIGFDARSVLSIARQGGCFHYQFVVEATEAKRGQTGGGRQVGEMPWADMEDPAAIPRGLDSPLSVRGALERLTLGARPSDL